MIKILWILTRRVRDPLRPISRPAPRGPAPLLRPAAILLAAAAGMASGSPLLAQGNDDCLACHSDRDLTGTRAGKSFSAFVDAKAFARSAHKDLECVSCHQDLAGAELPHAEDLKPVDCGACHDQESKDHAGSLHGRAAARGERLAPKCKTCHGTHEILPRSDPNSPIAVMNIPFLCGRCHREGSPVSEAYEIPQDRILENYSESIHGLGLFQKGLTVTAVCTSCHTAHRILPHTDPASSIARANVAKTCSKCHSQIERVHRKVVEGRLWEQEPNKIPACVDCHSPHKIRRVFYPAGMANKDCISCHGKKDLVMQRDGKAVSLYVDEDAYNASTHAGVACAQCHSEVTTSRTRACETIKSKVSCSVCHADQANQYRGSRHGALAGAGDADAPGCLDCHSKHATQSKKIPSSPTFPRNVPLLCAKCHRAGEKAAVRIQADVKDIVGSYIDSIHGKGLLQSGLVVTATCADCHSAHGELPPSDPNSTVNPSHLADTCGKCHRGIEEIFQTSIHWPGNAKTDEKVPTCEDCHTSHTISRTDNPDFRFRMMDQCGRCHEKEAETFFDTFHGKVSRLGSSTAAKCYDCHGTHNIRPPFDPASTLSRDNVVKTCGQCHAGSHRRFAGYLTHATHHDPAKYPWLFWSFWGMTALLVGTLTFSVIHTLAWLARLWLSREQWRGHKAAANAGEGKLYRRFDRLQRGLHLTMLVAFFTLASTGMALKFSYTGWAVAFAWLLGGFETTGVLHRAGAVTLLAVLGLHVWDLARKRKRWRLSWLKMITGPDTILFTPTDIKEFFGSIKWFFGAGPRPRYGRYTYWEKFDYFAVGWGIVIIGSTGLILWFPEIFTRVIPGWFINVATIIHSDEALLAVAFIFTIHFFNTHFRPDKFPMDPVIFTGRVTLEELRFDKPREYEALLQAGTLDEHIVEPIPKAAERGFRIFGFVALGVGLLLVALIIYAMVVGYR